MIQEFIAAHPMLFHIFIIAASLIVVIRASDLLVYGVTNYSKKLGLSDYIIGLIVVSIGASVPELISSIMGSILADSGIVLGTIIGSNVMGMTFVIGILAMVGKKIKVNYKLLHETEYLVTALCALPFLLLMNGILSRLDGIILIAAFMVYLIILWKKEGKMGRLKKDVKVKKIWYHSLVFVGSLMALLLSARWLVFSSSALSSMLNIPSYFLGLTVIAVGGSMPDITVSIRAILSGHQDVAFGDVLGSVVTKFTLFLGILALINPLTINPWYVINGAVFGVGTVTLTYLMSKDKILSWKEGTILFSLYFLFLGIEILVRWLV